MENSLISIIIPVYNVQKYIEECIESVLAQTYSNYEIILVDDGSSDDSYRICNAYSKTHNEIVLVHQENQGLSSARNTGMKKSSGEFLLFLDGDDCLDSNCLLEMVRRLDVDTDVICCKLTSKQEELDMVNSFAKKLCQKEALHEIFAEKGITTSVCGKLFRKSIWENILFPVGKIYEDYATLYKVFLKSNSIISLSGKGYYYRVTPGSITRSGFSERKMDYFVITEEVINCISKAYPDLIIDITNRRTRYAISFFVDAGKSQCTYSDMIRLLVGFIRPNIISYFSSGYKIRSKIIGLIITVFPFISFRIIKLLGRIIR